jgi:hypothetical protein
VDVPLLRFCSINLLINRIWFWYIFHLVSLIKSGHSALIFFSFLSLYIYECTGALCPVTRFADEDLEIF